METGIAVLVIDDDAGYRITLTDILNRHGYWVRAAASGDEALAAVDEQPPVVALVDLRLEDTDGLHLLGQIKQRAPYTECIILTGWASQASAIEAVNLGAYGYLQKPYNVDQLLMMIRQAVDKWRAAEDIRRSNYLLDAVGAVQAEFIEGKFAGNLFGDLLEHLLEISDSSYGFIAELAPNGTKKTGTEEPAPVLRAIHVPPGPTGPEEDPATEQQRETDTRVLKGLSQELVSAQGPLLLRRDEPDSPAGGSVFAEATGEGDRSAGPMADAGFDAFLGVPIYQGRQRIGGVGVARPRKPYDDGLLDYLQPFLKACASIIWAYRKEENLQQTQQKLQQSLTEKETLLKEIHHRVKNNLQVVSSLLHLQASQTGDDDARKSLQESRNRVQSMALVHERLYKSSDLSRIDFARYAQDLIKGILHSFEAGAARIHPVLEIEPVTLNIDQSIPCGLLITELITNSLKHGFPDGEPGEIGLQLGQVAEGGYLLKVWDTGVGLSADTDMSKPDSLGLQLVALLTEQLSGQLRVSVEGGTVWEIRFPYRA